MSLFDTIKKLHEDKGVNFDYENFVIKDRVGKNLEKISEGRYAIKNKISIIEEVKGLVSGGEFEIGKVKIDSSEFDIKFKLDSTDSEVISGTTITITRKAAPSDEAELAGIVNALYVKKDGSTGYKIGTDATDAIQLNCAATLFSTTTVGNCAAITTPVPTPTPKTTVSISDAKQGLNSVFYYAKDLIINKDIARYESASDSDKKLWASETRKIMTKLKSGIDGKIPGIDKIDGYNKIYLNDALGKPKDTKTFIKNIVEKDYKGKVESNADFSKKAACAKFNLNSSECTDPKIMESIKTNVCNNNLYAEKDTNAYKLFCDASTSDIDSLSFDSKLVTELDYA